MMINILISCFFAFIGCFFVAILYQTEKRLLIPTGFAGFLCYGVYALTLHFFSSAPLSTFAGAVAAAFFAEMMAQRLKAPATSLIIMGIFPIVPGAMAYDTVVALISGKYKDAGAGAVLTLALAACLAFGILFVTSIFRKMRFLFNRRDTV